MMCRHVQGNFSRDQVAPNPAHATNRPRLPEARLIPRCRLPRMPEENASTSLDLRFCQTACKLQVAPALIQQFCQSVWLCVERLQLGESQTHGTQNEQMWFLVAQPLLGLDLVSLEPQIPSQAAGPSPRPHSTKNASARCWKLTGEKPPPVVQHQLRAPRSPAWPLACCRQPSILGRAAHLHDLRHLLHDHHLLHCASSTFPWRPSARP